MQPTNRTTLNSSPTTLKPITLVKQISWDEMQKRRAQGLCFNCDAKFVPEHKCKGPQLLLLEGNYDESGTDDAERAHTILQGEPEMHMSCDNSSSTQTLRTTFV